MARLLQVAWMGGALLATAAAATEPVNMIVQELRPTPANPRNSEGAFATLNDGRILFCYTRFHGGDRDHSAARIAAIESKDGGATWSEPREILREAEAAGLNVMSVSLLRLKSGRLAMFYEYTRSNEDCRPMLVTSADEGKTWSAPRALIGHPGYYILNNDRVIRTKTGRILMPLNVHRKGGTRGMAAWYFSDDDAATWRESDSRWGTTEGKSGLQESGVVETAGGELFSWARTDLGSQYVSRSADDGVTWSAPQASELVSPLSPASIKRLPDSNRLLAIYNDHSGRFPFQAGQRTPLVAAISFDDGRTWPARRLVEDDTSVWYHYVAIHLMPDALLLAYNTGADQMARLSGPLRIRRIAYSWLPVEPRR